MKKVIRVLLITAAVLAALCCVIFAAETNLRAVCNGDGVTAEFGENGETLAVTYTDEAVTADGWYMFFMVKKNDSGAYIPSESSVLFMDQVTAEEAGTVSCTMYPTEMDECAVMLSGTGLDTPKIIAYVIGPDAQLNGTKYTTLQEALGAAKTDETVTLLRDVEMETLMVPAGVTLDLSGNLLTVTDYLMVYGSMEDTTDALGGLAVNAESTVFNSDNYLPIYDADSGCYRLFAYTWRSAAPKAEGNSVKFACQFAFPAEKAYALIAKGNSGLAFVFDLEWTAGDNQGELDVQFEETLMNRYAEEMGAGNSKVMVLTVSGLEKFPGIELVATPRLDAALGLSTCGDAISYPQNP